jgi:hypothetical protein
MTVKIIYDTENIVAKAATVRRVPTYALGEIATWAVSRSNYNLDETGLSLRVTVTRSGV